MLFRTSFLCLALPLALLNGNTVRNDKAAPAPATTKIFAAERDGKYNPKPSFTLTDVNGKKVSLSDFKGKFVYIDFWASWCQPCMAEVADTKDLQKDMSDKDITWIFISFDRNDDKWRKAIKQHGMTGIHLLAGDSSEYLKQEFGFDELPFYVWINKNGEIVVHDAPRPSTGIKRKLSHYVDKDSGQ